MGENKYAELLSNIEPCIFPTEEGLIEVPGLLKVVKMQCDTPDSLFALYTKNPETIFSMLRTAWGLVLRSHLGISDVCFGTLFQTGESGTSSKGNSNIVSGIQICQLSLLADLSVRNALEQARSEHLKSLHNLQASNPESGYQLAISSFCNTSVLITHDCEDPGASIQQLDLSLHIVVPVESMELSLLYKADKISQWTAKNVIRSFHEALQGVFIKSSGMISEIQLFGSHDQGVLDSWNTAPTKPVVNCLHSLIEIQTRIQPHATAVCSWEVEWSYEELDKLATCVASRLVKHGIRSEVMVPLYFEKSAWTIVAMVAVLKAGGAFVALDPRQPKSRVRAILAQLASPVLVTSARYAHKIYELGFDGSTSVIVSETSIRELEAEKTDFNSFTSPNSPAYIIYTSGSTGDPKGVVVEHEAICTSCAAHPYALSILPSSRVLQFASYSFDVSITDIFATLTVGGCVCVPSDEERNNVVKVINSLRVNYMTLTPTVLGLIQPADVPGIQTVVSGGEKLTTSVRDLWAGHVKLFNGYGPAECSVHSAAAQITMKTPGQNIGHAMGCRFWVVDSMNPTHLAPLGSIGELYIEGAILARGYLKDQNKTRAAFVNNPPWIPTASSGKPTRVYKTGDFVQYNYDGSLNFIGRKDLQVKIHGQRIELEEIEHHLRANLPEYRFIAVDLVRLASRPDAPVLVAFLSKSSDDNSDDDHNSLLLPMTESLRSKLDTAYYGLHDSLPAHMVPSIFAPLRNMPLNISRKLNRKILHQIASSLSLEESLRFSSALAPVESLNTDMEIALQALWSDVLHLPATLIRPESNFFLLGGNSMSVIRFLGAARDRQINLLAEDVFEHPTLRGLASRVSVSEPPHLSNAIEVEEKISMSFRESLSESILFDAANVEDVFEVTDVQKIFLFFNNLQNASGFMRISFTFEGRVDADRLETACRSLISEHPILRTIFISNGCQLLQVVLKNCPISFRRVSSEDWQHDVQANDCVASLDRFGAPYVHFVTIQSASEPTTLILQFSHAQYDGFCIPIIVKSMHSMIQGIGCRPVPKFSRFVASTHVNQEKSELYWRALLKDSPLTVLKAHSRAPYSFSQFRLKRQIIPFISMIEFGITTPSIIKAAWSLALAQLTGHHDVVFGEVVAGRNAPVEGIDRIVGPCFNVIPVRIRSQPRTCLDLLHQIEAQHIASMAHENLGYLTIIDRCTTWPKWQRLSSAVNLRTSIDPAPTELSFGDSKTKVSMSQKLSNFADIVLDTNSETDKMYINLAYDNRVLSSLDASTLLKYFCATVNFLVQSPTSSLSSWQKLDPQVQVLSVPFSEPGRSALSTEHMEDSDIKTCTHLVGKLWERLLLPNHIDAQRPFYEACNYFEIALVLRDSYHRIGADLTLEEIMDYPTFNDHVLLIARQRKLHAKLL